MRSRRGCEKTLNWQILECLVDTRLTSIYSSSCTLNDCMPSQVPSCGVSLKWEMTGSSQIRIPLKGCLQNLLCVTSSTSFNFRVSSDNSQLCLGVVFVLALFCGPTRQCCTEYLCCIVQLWLRSYMLVLNLPQASRKALTQFVSLLMAIGEDKLFQGRSF